MIRKKLQSGNGLVEYALVLVLVLVGVLALIALLSLFDTNIILPGPNPLENQSEENQEPAGIFEGLVHGMLSPITFFMSLIDDNYHFYEVHNDGDWYNMGFALGAGILWKGTSSRRKKSGTSTNDKK
jgi:hypothetical protein